MVDTNWLLPENRMRATPLNLFEQGIRNRDWAAVDAAWTMFTGQAVPTSQSTVVASALTEPKVKDLIENAKPQPRKNKKPETAIAAEDNGLFVMQSSKIQETKRKPVSKMVGKNKFVDDGSLVSNEIESSKAGKIPNDIKRRGTYKEVEVTCSGCGKKEKVDKDAANRKMGGAGIESYESPYKCNRCIAG